MLRHTITKKAEPIILFRRKGSFRHFIIETELSSSTSHSSIRYTIVTGRLAFDTT